MRFWETCDRHWELAFADTGRWYLLPGSNVVKGHEVAEIGLSEEVVHHAV